MVNEYIVSGLKRKCKRKIENTILKGVWNILEEKKIAFIIFVI